jgi:hypothetical protein
MLRIKKRSAWEYLNSSGQSVTLVISAGTGNIILGNPNGGKVSFRYASAGMGLGAVLQLPKSFSVSQSTSEMPSAGQVYLLDTFSGGELRTKDIAGCCLIGELSFGMVKGGYFTGMLLGIPPQDLGKELALDSVAFGMAQGAGGTLTDIAINEGLGEMGGIAGALTGGVAGQMISANKEAIAQRLHGNAKALLIMGGYNRGSQFGIGVSASVGYLWPSG